MVNQENAIRDLGVEPGHKHRGDCIFCGAHNTLSVENNAYELRWNCFSAGCSARGRVRAGVSGGTLRFLESEAAEVNKPEFVHPSEWVDPERSEQTLCYLKEFGCWQAYKEGRVQVRYDVKLDRAVFISPNGGLGRSLAGELPKWYKYGSNEGVIVRSSTTNSEVVVVEDPPSACAVSNIADSFALGGVSMSDDMLNMIMGEWSEVVVALDKDAAKKSIDIANKIRYYIDKVRVVLLDDDLKFLTTEQIEEKIG